MFSWLCLIAYPAGKVLLTAVDIVSHTEVRTLPVPDCTLDAAANSELFCVSDELYLVYVKNQSVSSVHVDLKFEHVTTYVCLLKLSHKWQLIIIYVLRKVKSSDFETTHTNDLNAASSGCALDYMAHINLRLYFESYFFLI